MRWMNRMDYRLAQVEWMRAHCAKLGDIVDFVIVAPHNWDGDYESMRPNGEPVRVV